MLQSMLKFSAATAVHVVKEPLQIPKYTIKSHDSLNTYR